MDVYLHHGGRWIMDPILSYVGGDVHIVEDFDISFLSIISVEDVYKSHLGYKNAHIYVLEPRMEMHEGIFLILDDNGISDSCHSRVIRNQQNLYPKFLLLS